MALQCVRKTRSMLFELGTGVLGLFVALIAVLVWCTTYPSLLTVVPLLWAIIVMCTNRLMRAYNMVMCFMLGLLIVRTPLAVGEGGNGGRGAGMYMAHAHTLRTRARATVVDRLSTWCVLPCRGST